MRIKHVVQGRVSQSYKTLSLSASETGSVPFIFYFSWKPDEYGRSRCYLATELMGKLTHAWSIESGLGVQCMTSQ